MKFIDESFAGMATSVNRVVELYQPVEKRLFDDRFAIDLLPFGWRILLRLLFLPGLRSIILLSHYLHDAIQIAAIYIMANSS